MTEYQESRKIGIKLLDSSQLQSSFPQYSDLCLQIQYQRSRAKNQNPDRSAGDEYYLMHDNIFGIFGGRGSGKTSVLFSMREAFLQQAPQTGDIVLPIVLPEIISENCSLLGWVLAMFGDIVSKIEQEIKRDPGAFNTQAFVQASGVDFFENCRFKTHNDFRLKYDDLYRECFDSTDNLTGHYSYGDAVNIRANQSSKQYALLKKLNQFWDDLARIKLQLTCFQKNLSVKDCERPLIIVMFDDIDLAPERSIELLTDSFKYFSNPNVTVIITAAMKMLAKVLECKMYEKVVGSNYNSLLQGMTSDSAGHRDTRDREQEQPYQLQRARESAEEYLNKVVPPASRYYLERFETCEQKLLFRYPKEAVNAGTENTTVSYTPTGFPEKDDLTSISLQDFLTERLDLFCGKEQLNNNFFYSPYAGDLQKRFIIPYLLVFGNKSRNISNGCLEFMNVLDQLSKLREKPNEDGTSALSESNYMKVYYALNHLLTVLIVSNTRRVAAYQTYADRLFLFHRGSWYFYIDYAALLDIYSDERGQIEARIMRDYGSNGIYEDHALRQKLISAQMREELLEPKRSIGTLFMILFMIEKLVLILFPGRKNTHGMHEFSSFLNMDILDNNRYRNTVWRNLKFFQTGKAFDEIIDQCLPLLENPKPFIYFDPFNESNLRAYLEFLFFHPGQENALTIEGLEESCHKDYDWSKTALSLLFIRSSGLLYVNEGYQSRYQLLLDGLWAWEFGEALSVRTNQSLLDFLENDNLVDTSKKIIRDFLKVISSIETKRASVPPLHKRKVAAGSLEDLFKSLYKLDQFETYIDSFCAECWYQQNGGEFSGEAPKDENGWDRIAQRVIGFTEKMIDQCRGAFLSNKLEAHILYGDTENVLEWISEISDISPNVETEGNRLIRQLHKQLSGPTMEDPGMENLYHKVTFTSLYRFIQEILYSKRTLAQIPYGHVYFDMLPNLVESCQIYASDPKELTDFVLRLHLLDYIAPIYYSAQFLLFSRRHSTEMQGSGLYGASETDFARVYHDISAYANSEASANSMLRQVFRQAKQDVVTDYARGFGGQDE